MTVARLLSDLRAKDIVLWVDSDKLRYRAPHGALSDELKSQLAKLKPDIIAFLDQGACKSEAIPLAPRDDVLPLSFAEEGLWLFDQINPGLTAWNMQSGLRIRGPLDVNALQKSLNSLIERHETLRTSFGVINGRAARVIAPSHPVELSVIPLDPSQNTDAEIDRIAAADEKKPFNLASAPLLRVKLLRVNHGEHVFLYTVHHIVSDSSSNRIFYRELFELYREHAQRKPSPRTNLPIQYADYALWQRRREREAMPSHLAYWKNKLHNFIIPEIPSDMRRPDERSYGGAKQRIALGTDLTHALHELCKQERATTFMLLVAVFNVLLRRYTGSSDIIVGAATAGRNRPELEHLIGMFVNILPLRTDLGGQPSFRDLLRRIREVCLEAYEHQDMPFEKLVEELNPGRGFSRNPFFQVLFDVANLPPNKREAAGLSLEPLPRSEDTARYEIVIRAPQTGAGMEIWIDYSVDLFSPARIAEMLEQYKYFLEQIVEDPEQDIDRYSLWTMTARNVLPDPTAALDPDWPGAVHELLALRAAERPDKIAVADATESWTYQELDQRANQLAWYLRAQGIGREDVVAIFGEARASLAWALMGIFRAGAAFFIVDPSHPPERLKEYLDAVRPKGLITLAGCNTKLQVIETLLSGLDDICRVELPSLTRARADGFLSAYSAADPKVPVGPDDLASVIFTSGSTGKPKGVMGRHIPLTHFLPWIADTFAISGQDRFSALAGLSSNILQREIFTALSLGAALHIPSTEIANSGKLDSWMRDNAITVAHLTPAMAQVLDQSAKEPIVSVRRVFFAGDLLTLRDVERIRELMPQAKIINFYASSESQRASGYKVFPKQKEFGAKEIPPLGRGVMDVQLLVVNGHEEMAGVGELGEIWVRSPHLARGYLGDEKLTHERFIINPYTGHAEDRVYRTGERGRFLPDGEVEFGGRLENQVSIRGFRIELNEVESALAQHPAVRDAVVVAREDAAEDRRLLAYVVPKREPAPTTSDLRGFLKQKLPEYMLPSAFVLLNDLPLTANGKVDRNALPQVNQSRPQLQNDYVAPRTPVEKVLAEIWAEILDLQRVGVHDNFFELGGHSIRAVRLVAEVERRFLKNVPVAMPFQAPTIAHMAKALARVRAAAPSSLLAIQTGGAKPPFFCVHGTDGYVPLARHLGPDQPFYGLTQHLDARKIRYTRIEDIAAHYIEELQRVQAEGPYFLGGHSVGGVIAFEMAQQLRQQGAEVALLALFDVTRRGAFREPPLKFVDRSKRLYWRFREVARPKRMLQAVPVHVAQGVKTVACNTYHVLGMTLPSQLQTFYVDEIVHGRLYGKALKRYEPRSYPGPVTFFWPAQRPDSSSQWHVVAQDTEVHWVPGNPPTLMTEPSIRMLANQLKSCLNKAQNLISIANALLSLLFHVACQFEL